MTFRQPREALKPGGFTLEGAEQWALEQTARLSADRFRLTSFWHIDYIIGPLTPAEENELADLKARYPDLPPDPTASPTPSKVFWPYEKALKRHVTANDDN